jgi:hypothetical protein
MKKKLKLSVIGGGLLAIALPLGLAIAMFLGLWATGGPI